MKMLLHMWTLILKMVSNVSRGRVFILVSHALMTSFTCEPDEHKVDQMWRDKQDNFQGNANIKLDATECHLHNRITIRWISLTGNNSNKVVASCSKQLIQGKIFRNSENVLPLVGAPLQILQRCDFTVHKAQTISAFKTLAISIWAAILKNKAQWYFQLSQEDKPVITYLLAFDREGSRWGTLLWLPDIAWVRCMDS